MTADAEHAMRAYIRDAGRAACVTSPHVSDAIELAIAALQRALTASVPWEVFEHIDTAFMELLCACRVQKGL